MHRSYAISFISEIKTHTANYIERELKNRGVEDLEASHGSILNILYKNNGKLPMKDISEKTKRSKSTITQLVDRLIRNGYVSKVNSDEDRRVYFIILTDKAWELKDAFTEISVKINEVFYEGFSEAETEQFIKMLQRVLYNFEK